MFPSPKELDAQSKISIDRWIEVDAEECQKLDNTYAFTKKCIKLGFMEPAYLFSDSDGRIWGKGQDGHYYPFHFTSFGKNLGYRMSTRAAN
jgi:hypothetical protein